MKHTLFLIAVFMTFGCLSAQNLERSNRKDRLDLLHLLGESNSEYEKDIDTKFIIAKTKSESNTHEAIDELEKIIISQEWKDMHKGFSPTENMSGIISMFGCSLEMVYKLYLINHDYLKAKATFGELSAMDDDDKKFPYENMVVRANIAKGKRIAVKDTNVYLFVDVSKNNVGVLFDSAKCDGIKFKNNNLKENNLVRMRILNKMNVNYDLKYKITLLFLNSDNQILQFRINDWLGNFGVVKDGRASFEDRVSFDHINDNDFIEINSIYQDTVITIKKIIVE